MTYTLIRSSRKTVAIQITPAGEVILRCPKRMSLKAAEAFLESRRPWVEEHLRRMAEKPRLPAFTPEEINALAEQAKEDLPRRVSRWAGRMGVSYGRITIRSQRSRWGSCTAKGDLNFNCLLMLCPEEVREYVVIHELCHRTQMNHSPQFWAEVQRHCPDCERCRKWLKDNGGSLIGRLPEKKEKP